MIQTHVHKVVLHCLLRVRWLLIRHRIVLLTSWHLLGNIWLCITNSCWNWLQLLIWILNRLIYILSISWGIILSRIWINSLELTGCITRRRLIISIQYGVYIYIIIHVNNFWNRRCSKNTRFLELTKSNW